MHGVLRRILRASEKGGFDTFKTRDIDFLIPAPSKITHKTDVPELVKDLGFVMTFGGSKGIIRLNHPDLILEFLVPERGRGSEKPVDLPQLGMNAVALWFLNFLTDNIFPVKIEDFFLYVPHQVNFSLHKLIVSQRRHNKDKSSKDLQMGTQLLNALVKKGGGAAHMAYLQFLGTTFLSAMLDNNVVADFAGRAIKGLELSVLHLFAMAQIAGYAVGGCWTHIGSAQSVVAYSFIRNEVDEHFTPFQWIKAMTPIVLEIGFWVTVVVFGEAWILKYLPEMP